MAIVTITVSNLIWFIDNSSVAATSDGRLTSPFKTIANFNAGSTAAASVVYIEHTGTNYTGPLTLQAGERLYGEGHSAGGNLSTVLPFHLLRTVKHYRHLQQATDPSSPLLSPELPLLPIMK